MFGTLTLKRFNGSEVFPVVEADVLILVSEGDQFLNLEIQAGKRIEGTTDDTVDSQERPNAEVSIHRNSFDPSKLVEQRFLVDSGYDDEREEWVGRFYYFEHENLNENVVEFLEFVDGRYHVKWTGVTQDVNFYDGSKPDTIVEIDASFALREPKKS